MSTSLIMHAAVHRRRLFEQCPHPDEKQRAALGKRVRLQPSQVKFWFQNRRTQLKVVILNQSSLIDRSNILDPSSLVHFLTRLG